MADKIILILMIIASVIMAIFLVYMVKKLCTLKGYQRIKFMSEYKKGRFCFIYLASLFIYYAVSIKKSGLNFMTNLTESLKCTFDAVAMKIDYQKFSSLNENLFYKVIDISFIIFVSLNVCLFLFSFVSPSINRKRNYCHFLKKDEKIIFIGCNNDTYKMIDSLDLKENGCLVIGSFDNESANLLMDKAISFRNVSQKTIYSVKSLLSSVVQLCFKKNINSNIKIIVHTQDEEKNLLITRKISLLLEDNLFKDNKKVQAYVLGYGVNQTAFDKFMEKTKGKIHYINKHHQIAIDFIDRYPFTKFMNDNHIDYETGTIKSECNLNVYMIGYGKTNQEIFLSSIANNQFCTINKGNVEKKNINYYIYDKNNIKVNKNLNHYFYRLENEYHYFKDREEDFLPLDVNPANVINSKKCIDINDNSFYLQLYNDICNTNNNDINYIIISIGSKTENMDMADKITSKIHEWNIEKQTHVFVRIQDSQFIENSNLYRDINYYEKDANVNYTAELDNKTISFNRVNKCTKKELLYNTFGEEDLLLYNVNRIFNDQQEIFARNRDVVYSLKKDDDIEKTKQFVQEKWYEKTQIQRESNYFAYLNIRTKLHLMGYDFVSKNDFNEHIHSSVSFDEFYKKYFENSEATEKNVINVVYDNKPINIVEYQDTLEFAKCRRTFLAMQEHFRWNAYTISKGVIPSTKQEILCNINDGKDYEITRKHNCITTFEGLKELDYLLSIKKYIIDLIHKQNEDLSKKDTSIIYAACELLQKDFIGCKNLFDNLPTKVKESYLLNNDVIKYDFQILDNLKCLFEISDIVLIKKNNL